VSEPWTEWPTLQIESRIRVPHSCGSGSRKGGSSLRFRTSTPEPSFPAHPPDISPIPQGRVAKPRLDGRPFKSKVAFGCPILAGLVHARVGLLFVFALQLLNRLSPLTPDISPIPRGREAETGSDFDFRVPHSRALGSRKGAGFYPSSAMEPTSLSSYLSYTYDLS